MPQQPEPQEQAAERDNQYLECHGGEGAWCRVEIRLIHEEGGNDQYNKTANQLIQQGVGTGATAQAGGAYDNCGCTPGHGCAQAKQITQQRIGTASHGRAAAAGKGDHNPCKGDGNTQPLHFVQALVGYFPVKTKSGKYRRGVQENNHMRRRGVMQPFGNQQKFQGKKQPGRNAWFPGAVREHNPVATRVNEDIHHDRRNTRAQGDLEYGRHVWRRTLEYDLLQAPDRANQQHQPGSFAVDCTAVFHFFDPV